MVSMLPFLVFERSIKVTKQREEEKALNKMHWQFLFKQQRRLCRFANKTRRTSLGCWCCKPTSVSSLNMQDVQHADRVGLHFIDSIPTSYSIGRFDACDKAMLPLVVMEPLCRT